MWSQRNGSDPICRVKKRGKQKAIMHPNYQRFAQMNGILNVISQSRYVLGALTHDSAINKHIGAAYCVIAALRYPKNSNGNAKSSHFAQPPIGEHLWNSQIVVTLLSRSCSCTPFSFAMEFSNGIGKINSFASSYVGLNIRVQVYGFHEKKNVVQILCN